jgi:hypothetical protein
MKSPDGRECSTFRQHRKLALSGKKTTTLYLLNPDERIVEQIEVDGCAIMDGIRCDWLVRLNDATSKEEIYVELKGSDVRHAVEQLRATIVKLSADRAKFPKRCFVVFTRNPLTGTDVQQLKLQFRKTFNSLFQPVRDKAEIPL